MSLPSKILHKAAAPTPGSARRWAPILGFSTADPYPFTSTLIRPLPFHLNSHSTPNLSPQLSFDPYPFNSTLIRVRLWWVDPSVASVLALYIFFFWLRSGRQQVDLISGRAADSKFLE